MKRKVLLAAFLSLALLLLVGFGWLKSSSDWPREIVRPLTEKGIERQLEDELKSLAFKEGLRLLTKPKVYSGGTLVATFSGRFTCLFNLKKELKEQFASLQFVLWRAKIEGRMPKEVDLRFSKPVIRY